MHSCERCGGGGVIRHPRFGKPSCPTPEVTCPDCGGDGVTEDADDFRAHAADHKHDLEKSEPKQIV